MAVGSLPAANTSRRGVRHQGPGTESGGLADVNVHQTRRVARKSRGGSALRASSMKACQMGAAPSTPETWRIGRLSALPTQTPVTRLGV